MQHPFSGIVLRNALYIFWGMLISNASLLLTHVLLARNLTKDNYGTFMTIQYIVNIILVVMNFGIPDAVTKQIAGHLGSGQRHAVDDTINRVIRLAFCICSAFFILQWGAAGVLSDQFAPMDITFYIRLTALWGLPVFVSVLGAAVIEGYQDMRHSYLVRNLREPVKLIVLLVLLWISAFSIRSIHVAWTAAYWIVMAGTLVFLAWFIKKARVKISWRAQAGAGALFRAGLPFYLPYLGPLLVYSILPVMVSRLSGVREVAEFSVSMQLISTSALLLMPLSKALLPAVSHAFQKSPQAVSSSVTNTFRATGAVNLLLLLILGFGGPLILRAFYGQQYARAGGLLLFLMFAFFFENYKYALDPLLKGIRFAPAVAVLESVRLAALFVSGYFLIRCKGGLGAAMALGFVSLPVLCIKVIYIQRQIGIVLWPLLLKETFLAVLIFFTAFIKFNFILTFIGICAASYLLKIASISDITRGVQMLRDRNDHSNEP